MAAGAVGARVHITSGTMTSVLDTLSAMGTSSASRTPGIAAESSST
jgi:hypothetical protein